MNDGSGTRVILLARPGDARSKLEAAVREAGADLVLVADPSSADIADLSAAGARAVLVALEPEVEDALERLDRLLSDPAITVIFDEAELAAQREGWDAARWVRHLAAKLNRHDDVLPPGWDVEADDGRSSAHAVAATGPLWSVAPDVLVAEVADAPASMFDLDDADAGGEDGLQVLADGLLSAEDMDWSSSGTFSDGVVQDNDFNGLDASPLTLAYVDVDEVDDVEEVDGRDEVDAGRAPAACGAGPGGSAPAGLPPGLGDTLSLADDDAPIATLPDAGGQRVLHDLEALDARASGLSLADTESYGHGPVRGAVVVEGGLGGPDALRQLLGALPEGFPRAVLVRLQLDGGRYDRLVTQMERASRLPVALAVDGTPAEPGNVYFLTPRMSVVVERGRLVFVEAGDADVGETLHGALPGSDSAMLFLSGSDAGLAAAAAALAGAGALVGAQSPDSCYDATAPTLLIAHGGAAGSPAELAGRLADRWPS